MKQMKREKLTVEILEKLQFEIKIMAQVEHENIVKFYGASWDTPPNVCIILEYMAGGTLTEYLEMVRKEQEIRGWRG